ncbi:MAG TPA: hypothetical protein VFN78_12070 [Ktedonobacterales bacterium]|nr:hypothetical protein [Ktedonobacterales bacterium]
MSDYHDDDDAEARQRRLAALRGLASQAERIEPSASITSEAQQSTDVAPASPQPAPSRAPLLSDTPRGPTSAFSSRRWRASALAVVAALIVIAVVVGAILHASGVSASLPQLGAKPTPALTDKIISTVTGKPIYCPSTPAWSPNGQSLATFGQTNMPTDSCGPYIPQTAIAQLSGGSAAFQSSNQPTGLALDIISATTRQVTRQVALPALFQHNGKTRDPAILEHNQQINDLLCDHSTLCQVQSVSLQSLAWSPDGRSIVIFFTYQLLTDYNAPPLDNPDAAPATTAMGGGLVIAQVAEGASAPRVLLHTCPKQPYTTTTPNQPAFIWNLATGTATDAALPGAGSLDTVAFAPAYQWTSDGQIIPLTAAAPTTGRATITPWRAGAIAQPLQSPGILYRTSQWLWSPDGHYAMPNLATATYVNMNGAGAGATSDAGYAPPLTNAPDAATSAAIRASLTIRPGVELARNADGSLLASYACQADGSALLTIRPTRSAAQPTQATYSYPSSLYSYSCFGDIGDLIWSPDGSRIAIADAQDEQIIIWQIHTAS